MTEPDLLPPAKRPWGTGSIELRRGGYLARWRNEHGRQESKLFRTAEEASDYLGQVYPAGARLLRRSDIVSLIEHWRKLAEITAVPPGTRGKDEDQRASYMIRDATAQAFTACANELGRLLGI